MAKANGKKKYRVQHTIDSIEDKVRVAGEMVELDDETAAPLLAARALIPHNADEAATDDGAGPAE